MTKEDTRVLEPVVGVYGLRTFRVSLDGELLPITQLSDDWVGGRCIARCVRRQDHSAPQTACTCGIYSFRDRGHLKWQFSAADSLIAVVALEGATVEGEHGWRSQAAQVVAIWIADDALPGHLRSAVLNNLSAVREYQSPEEMVSNFPFLTISREAEPAAESWRSRVSTKIHNCSLRQSLIQGTNFLITAAAKTLAITVLLQAVPLRDQTSDPGILQVWFTASRNLLIYLVLNPAVVIAWYATTAVFGVLFAIGQARKRIWLRRSTWRAATLAVAMPAAAALAGLKPPWLAWSGFLAVNVVVHFSARAIPIVVPAGQLAVLRPRPRYWAGSHDLHVHEIIQPVTFPRPNQEPDLTS